MRYAIPFLFSLFLISIVSCRTDFDFEPNVGNLRFSKDTVYLDTVFTNIGSSTYTLKVYNNTNKNIAIPILELGEKENSKYRLMVDGIPGKVFKDVELLAKDSMFIFIETTINYDEYANSNTNFLYTDIIKFGTETNFQKVDLVTLVQDAVFIKPNRTQNPDETYTYEQISLGTDNQGNPVTVKGHVLNANDPTNGNELLWTNEKPYVVYGLAAIPPNETLTIEAGAHIHFHDSSGLIVPENSQLKVNEEQGENVIFEGDRLEYTYSEVPGQWLGIIFAPNSEMGIFKNTTIKNSIYGIYSEQSENIDLFNVQIYNCSQFGILALSSTISGKNIVINNCGIASFAAYIGGTYNFTHATLANYWNKPNQTCVSLQNYLKTQEGIIAGDLVQANFTNSILYGSSNISLSMRTVDQETNQTNGVDFNYIFKNCLIKSIDTQNLLTNNPLYQFNNTIHFQNCIIARNSNTNKPEFLNPNKNKLQIGENSIAKGNASFLNSNFPDITNQNRTNPSDIGAYNWISFD